MVKKCIQEEKRALAAFPGSFPKPDRVLDGFSIGFFAKKVKGAAMPASSGARIAGFHSCFWLFPPAFACEQFLWIICG
jgi:hypothetical protein